MGAVYLTEDKQFKAVLESIRGKVSDLRIPFAQIRREFFKGNKAIFALKGPGKYADFKNTKGGWAYRLLKRRILGSEYPLLRFSGALEDSLTNPTDSMAIDRVVDKLTLFVGTRIPYAHFHQTGTRVMAKRPVLLLGPEQVSPPGINRRRELWIKHILDYVGKVTKGET